MNRMSDVRFLYTEYAAQKNDFFIHIFFLWFGFVLPWWRSFVMTCKYGYPLCCLLILKTNWLTIYVYGIRTYEMTRTIYWLQISFTFGNMSGSGKEKKRRNGIALFPNNSNTFSSKREKFFWSSCLCISQSDVPSNACLAKKLNQSANAYRNREANHSARWYERTVICSHK